MPRLTLCLIARNEERMLPGCLESVRGVVDRVVVVDTGSTDATAAVARSRGAKLIQHRWQDDFAAARNAALERVTSGFVLVLDADERLAPGAGEALRSALRQGRIDLGLLPLHNAASVDAGADAVISGASRIGDPILLPRLLRRTPDLRWEGVVHENVAAWARKGRRTAVVEAPIIHYGAIPELRIALGKDQRNLHLLERRRAQEPDDPTVRAYLARELQRGGEVERALEESAAGWDLLSRSRDHDTQHDVLLPATIQANLLLDAGRLEEAQRALEAAIAWQGRHPNFEFLAGVLAERRFLSSTGGGDELATAEGCYQRCLASAGKHLLGELIPGATGWQAATRLGTVHLLRGDPGRARAAFEQALAERPGYCEALLGRAEALLEEGAAAAALNEVQPFVEALLPDAWLLGAEAALRLGARSDAELFSRRTLELLEGQRFAAPHRRRRLRALESALSAQTKAAKPPRGRSVLVLGSGRSGTSMVAGTLAHAGWYVGDDPHPARASNPKGFFETFAINGINEYLLAEVLPGWPRYDPWQRWLAQLPLDMEFAVVPEIAERIERLVVHRPFAFKDPRFCYTLPAWRPFLGDAGFVCVFRDPSVTVESIVTECRSQAYLESAQVDHDAALATWTCMYRHVLERLRHEGDWLFLHYDQMLEPEGLTRLESFVGAPVCKEFPEPSLSRTRSERAVPAETAELYKELCALAGMKVQPLRAAPRRGSVRLATSAEPELSVVLCTYNRRAVLEKCLDALALQRAPRERFELVVVNDGSNDGTTELLAGRRSELPMRVVERENGGLAAARNSGIAEARGSLLLFINDDTIAFPDLVERHLEIQQRLEGERVAVVGSFEQPRFVLANALMRYLERSMLVFCFCEMRSGEWYDWNRFWTCNVSVSAEAVRASGGFDEDFRHYGCEDTDLGIRLAREGCRFLYDSSARAQHDHVFDLNALERRNRAVARAWVRLFRKHAEAREHRDWRSLSALSLDDCERYVVERLPRIPGWKAAASQLAGIDLSRLEGAGPSGARMAEDVLAHLGERLEDLNRVWWREGLAAGLREFAASERSERLVGESQPGGAVAARQVFAWPRYQAGEELDLLLQRYGKVLAGREGVRLFLRHDAEIDGPVEAAVEELERVYRCHVADNALLDVVLITEPLTEDRLEHLRRSIDLAIELPGSSQGARQALLEALPAPRVRSAKQLEAELRA